VEYVAQTHPAANSIHLTFEAAKEPCATPHLAWRLPGAFGGKVSDGPKEMTRRSWST
jgi:hypothetical protein